MTSHYLEDWLSARAESEKTKYSYVKNVEVFSDFAEQRGQHFDSIVEAWRKVKRAGIDEREDFLEAWNDIVRSFNTQIKKKYAPLSVKNLLATIKSFCNFWNIPVRVHLPKRACVIYHNKDLTREETKQILTFATPRDRVIWLVMAESGMRVSTAIHIKYWQIKEDFEAEKIPMRIHLPSESLKDHVGDRFTFIGEDGFRELKQHLQGRLPLEDDDYIFKSEKEGLVKGEQFSVASLSVKFSRIVVKLGLAKPRDRKPKAVRQHGLRKYFRNNMKADSAYIKFWGGWSLGTDTHYISREVEKHRKLYQEGYPHLRIYDIAEGIFRREDIEKIVEARIQEKVVEIERLKEKLKDWEESVKRLEKVEEDQRTLTKRIRELKQESKRNGKR